MLRGIYPIVFIPFDESGAIDEAGLRRIVRFELDGGVHGIGINGFASEAYKLTDDERRRAVEIVAEEVAGGLPLIIGIAPGSTEAAIQQAAEFSAYSPAALMTLPPTTMKMPPSDLVDYYVALGNAADAPIMVQQSPHLQAYSATGLDAPYLAEIADRAPNVQYFKIEGPGSPERIAALAPLVDRERVIMFGGGGGITLLDELKAGASGLIPGVGYNEYFMEAWAAWEQGQHDEVERIIGTVQPLVSAISGPGHEFSLHARKYLMQRAGYIDSAYVRRPTVPVTEAQLAEVGALADALTLRISQS